MSTTSTSENRKLKKSCLILASVISVSHSVSYFMMYFQSSHVFAFFSDGVHLNSVSVNMHLLNPDTCSQGLAAAPSQKGIKRGISSALRPSVYSFISFAHSSSVSPLCFSFNLSTLFPLPSSPLWKSGSFSE